MQGAFAERLQIEGGAQRAADQALDFLRAAGLLAARRFAVHARVRRARQHAVLGRQPALTLALQETRHLVFDAGGADDLGVAALDQHRAFGMLGVLAGDADGAQRVDGAAARAGFKCHGVSCVIGVAAAILPPRRHATAQGGPRTRSLQSCPAKHNFLYNAVKRTLFSNFQAIAHVSPVLRRGRYCLRWLIKCISDCIQDQIGESFEHFKHDRLRGCHQRRCCRHTDN